MDFCLNWRRRDLQWIFFWDHLFIFDVACEYCWNHRFEWIWKGFLMAFLVVLFFVAGCSAEESRNFQRLICIGWLVVAIYVSTFEKQGSLLTIKVTYMDCIIDSKVHSSCFCRIEGSYFKIETFSWDNPNFKRKN